MNISVLLVESVLTVNCYCCNSHLTPDNMGDPEPGPSSTTLPVPSTSCYICQNPGGNLVQQPQISSFELFIQSVTSRALYGDQQAITVKGRLGDATADVLMRNHVKWHRDCYKDMTHKVHIERLKSRYEEALRVGEAPKQGIKGRPMARTHTASPPDDDTDSLVRYTRSQSKAYDTNACFFSVTANLKKDNYTKSAHSTQETSFGK